MAFLGTTQRLPPEPGVRSEPGHREVSQSNLASAWKRPYHQLPENRIGALPWMKETPASSALVLVDFLLM